MSLTRSARGTLENPGQGVTIKAAINRSMLEQTWGEFAQILTYKAEGAGMSVVRVDPSVYLADVQQVWRGSIRCIENKRETGFASDALIAATTSIEALMRRKTYW